MVKFDAHERPPIFFQNSFEPFMPWLNRRDLSWLRDALFITRLRYFKFDYIGENHAKLCVLSGTAPIATNEFFIDGYEKSDDRCARKYVIRLCPFADGNHKTQSDFISSSKKVPGFKRTAPSNGYRKFRCPFFGRALSDEAPCEGHQKPLAAHTAAASISILNQSGGLAGTFDALMPIARTIISRLMPCASPYSETLR